MQCLTSLETFWVGRLRANSVQIPPKMFESATKQLCTHTAIGRTLSSRLLPWSAFVSSSVHGICYDAARLLSVDNLAASALLASSRLFSFAVLGLLRLIRVGLHVPRQSGSPNPAGRQTRRASGTSPTSSARIVSSAFKTTAGCCSCMRRHKPLTCPYPRPSSEPHSLHNSSSSFSFQALWYIFKAGAISEFGRLANVGVWEAWERRGIGGLGT